MRIQRFLRVLVMAAALPAAAAFAQGNIYQATLQEPNPATPEVSTDELKLILQTGSAVVFDARPFMEFAVSHIPGALNVAPKPGLPAIVAEMRYMGQDLANPPTVEGWHTGKEWIDSGTLVERINFTADQMGNINLPGVRTIINRLSAEGPTLSAERLLDGCLTLLGHYALPEDTRSMLLANVPQGGEHLRTGTGYVRRLQHVSERCGPRWCCRSGSG